jgi:biopolymer transport protein ExbB/TolQ
MNLTERILGFMLLGSEWVLWLLIGLSVLSVAVMVERGIYLRAGGDADRLARELGTLLRSGDVEGARQTLAGQRAPAAIVAAAGLEHFERGSDAVAEAMASAKARLRTEMERNLGVLGTLGNNAPFIGLFGTVLGIIKAFADLARNQGGGAGAVMSGISEALVATAVGLMVAIPAVIAFNFFQGKVRKSMARVDTVAHLLLAGLTGGTAVAAAATGVNPAAASVEG